MDILANIDNPRQLEKLYRDNKTGFRKAFNTLYPQLKENKTAQVWNERLNFEGSEISWGAKNELLFVIVLSFAAGLIAKIPAFASIDENLFYQRNVGLIVFPMLIAYFAWKQKLRIRQILISSGALLVSGIYINLLPSDNITLPGDAVRDTVILACIHLPLFLWTVLGFTFVGNNLKDQNKRLDFLRYTGDLAVMTAVILISGAILTGITFGLFSLIDVDIESLYTDYIIVWGLAASPIVGTYLVRANPQLVNKVLPIIAKVFSPLVLITLLFYLAAVIYSGKNPYNDRDFLIIFNVLLIGVMAIILFSIAETSKSPAGKFNTIVLLCLSIVTIAVNGIALSAIVFRISEWGITPNRLAVLGSNLLILTNLLIVTYRLFKTVKDRSAIEKVETSIASFLPLYSLWTMVVIFVFPILFSFE
jgi:hypothetical protein